MAISPLPDDAHRTDRTRPMPGQFIEPRTDQRDRCGQASPPRSGVTQGGGASAGSLMASGLVTLAQVALSMPWLMISLFVLAICAQPLPDPWNSWVVLAWLAAGPVMLVPRTQVLMARVFGARPPMEDESALLQTCWAAVAHGAGVPAGRYWIGVQNTPEVNTRPVGTHAHVVTSWAVSQLTPLQLQAILAQSLAHLRSGNPALILLSYWYALPARLAMKLLLVLCPAAVRMITRFSLLNWIIVALLVLIAVVAAAKAIIYTDQHVLQYLLITPLVAPPLLAWLDRVHVYRADHLALAMGYGTPLQEALQVSYQIEEATHGSSGLRRLLSSTPPVAARINALNTHLERRP